MIKTTTYVIGLDESVKWFKKGILDIQSNTIHMTTLLADSLTSIVTRHVLHNIKPNIQETLEYIKTLNPAYTLSGIIEVGLTDPELFDALFVDFALELVIKINEHLQLTSLNDVISLEGIGSDYIVINVYQESPSGNIHYR